MRTFIIVIIVIVIIIYLINKKVEQEQKVISKFQASIPDMRNKSYINENTNEIILCSSNFPQPISSKWIVSDNAITIITIKNMKDIPTHSNSRKTIPFSKISSIEIKNNILSFDVIGAYSTRVDSENNVNIDSLSPYAFILFNDSEIARAVQKRIIERS